MIMNSLTRRLIAGLSRLPGAWATILGLVVAALVGWFDYVTGYDFQVTAFYVLPLCWTCWAAGRKAGLALAAASTVFALAADVFSGHAYQHPAIAYWNALMLLVIFVVAVFSVTAALDAYRSLAEAQALLRQANEDLEKR